jgi:N-acetylmuramoyl-L-alanine amidase
MLKWIYLFFLCVIFTGCQAPKRHMKVQEKPHVRQVQYDNQIAVVKQKPVRVKQKDLIVIDAGHGGEDRGTSSTSTPKYQEKSLNLSTAMFLKEYLQKMGYQVKMTRSDDTFISLPTRSLMANNYNAKLFLSVHFNAAFSEQADGIEVYYYQSDDDKIRSSNSKKLADSVLSQIIEKTSAKSRGVKHGNLAVIRETTMPAVLVEGGFMTNKLEMDKIKDPSYIKQLAFGIAVGVDNYLQKQ